MNNRNTFLKPQNSRLGESVLSSLFRIDEDWHCRSQSGKINKINSIEEYSAMIQIVLNLINITDENLYLHVKVNQQIWQNWKNKSNID
jgi:hypothetical protein